MRRLCAALLLPVLASAPARARDTLTIGVAQFPASLHPYIDPQVVTAYVHGFVLRPVTAFDADWKNGCMMCTELPTLANGRVTFEDRGGGKRGLAVRLTLRDGLKWGDGVPVSTADLAFTARIGRDANAGFADARTWGRVASMDIVDPLNAVLHYDETSALFDRLPDLLPEHVERAAYERSTTPGEYARQTVYNRAPTTPGLFDGPFLMTGYSSGQQIVLEPNPYWSGPKPGFARIVVKLIENTAALQANLLSGDIDMAPGDAPSLTLDQVLSLRKQQPDRFAYVFRPALTYEHIDLDLANPILADIRVRRALLLALDRKTMAQRLFEGMQPVAASFVNPSDPMYDPSIPVVAYDPAAARALLAEAGWTPGADGICRNTHGERLSLEFHTTAGNRLRELQQQVMQSQWKTVGVEIVIKNEPARTFFGEVLKKRQTGGLSMYAWSTGISYPPRQTQGSENIPTAANGYSGTNYMGWRDDETDAAIAAAETELDPAKQKPIWSVLQHRYAIDVPVLPLFFRSDAGVIPTWLRGYTDTGHTDYGTEWAENWRSE